MANETITRHLAKLDFDVSGVANQLGNVETMLKNASDEAENTKKSFDKVFENFSTQKNISPILNYDDATKYKNELEEILKTKGEISKLQFKTDADGGLYGASVEITDSQGKKIRESFELVQKSVENAKTGVKEYESAWVSSGKNIYQSLKTLQEQQDDFYKKNMSQFDFEIKQREIQGQNFSKQLKEQMQGQQLLNKEMEAAKVTYGGGIIDMVKWELQHRAVMLAEQAFTELISVMKETEFAVMEITRVLNDETLNVSAYTEEMYNIGVAYGRLFEDVSEVTLRFAQAGYDANDSLEMTRTTMLALNTAELDVNNATNSLIGIMQQWKMEAEDYVDLVDKINITADNYALTSQDLVDALLKSSSVAKNAGIEFNDLVSILTTLKVSSGQAGSAVGNAFRSIISYIQRPASLAGFEEMGIAVFADEAKTQLLPMMDILQNMSDNWKSMGTAAQDAFLLQNNEMIKTLDITGELARAEEELRVMQAEGSGALQEEIDQSVLAAGNLRRNYYIALMESWEEVANVNKTVSEYTGYSARENAKYMDTLEAKTNSLVTSLHMLAVQASDAGLLDFAKWLVDTSTSIVKLTKDAGGLNVVVGFLASAFLMIKRQQINDFFSKVSVSLDKTASSAKKAEMGLKSIGFAGWASIAVSAITLVVGAINSYNEAQKQMIIESGERAKKLADENDALYDLEERYRQSLTLDEASKNAELESIKSELVSAYGAEASAIDDVNNKRKTALDLIEQERKTNYDEWYLNEFDAWKEARQKIEEQQPLSLNLGTEMNPAPLITGEIEKYIDAFNQANGTMLEIKGDSLTGAGNAIEEVQLLTSLYSEYSQNQEARRLAGEQVAAEEETFLRLIQERIEMLKGVTSVYQQAYESGSRMEAENYLREGMYFEALEAEQSIENLERLKQVADDNIESESILAEMWALLDERAQMLGITFSEVATEIENVGDSTESVAISIDEMKEGMAEAQESVDGLKGKLSELQSSYSTLQGIVSEYNETGQVTADMIISLMGMGYEYVDVLEYQNGAMSINESKLYALQQARTADAEAAIKEQFALNVLSIATNAAADASNNATIQASYLRPAFANLSGETQHLAGSLFDAAGAGLSLSNVLSALNNSGFDATGIGQAYQNQINQAINATNTLLGALGGMSLGGSSGFTPSIPTYSSGGGGGGSSSSSAERERIQAQIDNINSVAQAEIDALQRVQEQRDRNREIEDAMDDIESARSRSGIEARKAEYEAEKELAEKREDWDTEDKIAAIEAERDAQVEALQAQMDALSSGSSGVSSGISSMRTNLTSALETGVEETEEASELMHDAVVDEFANPIANDLVSSFEMGMEIIGKMAVNHSRYMFNVYRSEFIEPMYSALVNMPFNVGSLPTMNGSAQTTNNTTNNINFENQNNITSAFDERNMLSRYSRQLMEGLNR